MVNNFWHGKKVFVTGHTGFKGSWLCLWLHRMGADVTGYALPPPTKPSLFEMAQVGSHMKSVIADIRDFEKLKLSLTEAKPEIVFHMAAQPLVRYSYIHPIETYMTNVMGTVHLFEAIKSINSVRSVVNITTDKCYENKEDLHSYREDESLGGYDPYSSSKACAELVTSAYRQSFFNTQDYPQHQVAIASVRAGNVIGGGDWATDRLIPDIFRSISKNENVIIRNPKSIRPWQHVLEPLDGYLNLAQKLYELGPHYAQAYNFGPHEEDSKEVEWIVKKIIQLWKKDASYVVQSNNSLHEAKYLKLDCGKAKDLLGWQPKWTLETALIKIVDWHQNLANNKQTAYEICLMQIEDYTSSKLA